jgi:hypothetical protein
LLRRVERAGRQLDLGVLDDAEEALGAAADAVARHYGAMFDWLAGRPHVFLRPQPAPVADLNQVEPALSHRVGEAVDSSRCLSVLSMALRIVIGSSCLQPEYVGTSPPM